MNAHKYDTIKETKEATIWTPPYRLAEGIRGARELEKMAVLYYSILCCIKSYITLLILYHIISYYITVQYITLQHITICRIIS